jgi:anti-anti-sigma factor
MRGTVSVSSPGLVVLTGEIDLTVGDQLAAVRPAFGAQAGSRAAGDEDLPLNWIVDLREVTFMDSTGLGFLAHTHRVVSERGGTVTVVGPSPLVMRTLTIVHLDEVLKIVEEMP